MSEFHDVTLDNVSQKAAALSQRYCLRLNTVAGEKACSLSDKMCVRVTITADTILFNNSTADFKVREFIFTDRDYNVLSKFELKTDEPWLVSAVVPYKNFYIVCYIDTKPKPALYLADIYSDTFNREGELAEIIPFFKDRQIAFAVSDTAGGIFFLEAYTGMLHYMADDGQITSYNGNFMIPNHASFFNGSLYIADIHKVLELRETSNIIAFKDGVFHETGILGGCIEGCDKLNCFFVTSSFAEKILRKYDYENNLIFEKNFDYEQNVITPRAIGVNKNHLLIIDGRPYIYDIF
ncbi:MAG: hypothetical protein RBU23_04625 [Candidatus Auribacterota bacterium]|jgi:hypothetical protein|nr:hypothetical protein [Candidatus Auribacterota bacterium]